MYIHEEAKLVFLANPRTGSTSVAKALMEIGFKKVGTHHSAFVGPDKPEWPQWVTFAVVRNHWDAAVSWVFGRHLGQYKDLEFSLEDFRFALDNEHVGENKMWPHTPHITTRYEILGGDLDSVLRLFNLPPVQLPRENISVVRRGRHYREFYTDETRDYIGNRFKEEIERLGYDF